MFLKVLYYSIYLNDTKYKYKNGCRAPKNVGTCEYNSREPPFMQKLYYLKYREGGGG